MRFLIDASAPRSTGELIRRYGHESLDVRDILPGATPDEDVGRYAQQHGFALVTRDFDFSDIRNYPPADYPGIIVLQMPDDAVASVILKTLESFLSQPHLLERLPGRLAIVEMWRVRFRPA